MYLILPAALWPWGRPSLEEKWVPGNFLGGKGWPARKADNLTAICEPIILKLWEPRRITNLWASTSCYRERFTFLPIFTVPRMSINHIEITALDGPSLASTHRLRHKRARNIIMVHRLHRLNKGNVTVAVKPHSKLKSRLSVSFSRALYFLTLIGLVSQVLLKRIATCITSIVEAHCYLYHKHCWSALLSVTEDFPEVPCRPAYFLSTEPPVSWRQLCNRLIRKHVS
jgi:hypothetical protein